MPRKTEQRVEDSIAKLETGGDAWLATSGPAGPHLVPLSLAWYVAESRSRGLIGGFGYGEKR